MNRRGFLRALAYAAPAALVAADVARTYFLPPAAGWRPAEDAIDWVKQYTVTTEVISDNLYLDIGRKYSEALARSILDTKRVRAAHILSSAFEPMPFKEPDPALFDLLKYIDRYRHAHEEVVMMPPRLVMQTYAPTQCLVGRDGHCITHGSSCSNVNPVRRRRPWYSTPHGELVGFGLR